MKNNLTFWISIGSTYTYLTALRLSKFIRDNDFDISFKIINIRWIMKKMDNVPFPPSKPSKVNYMWKDIQRRAEIYQIPIPKIPAPYPLKYFDEANLYALTALEEGWFVQYLENTYRYWFLEEIPAGSDENIKLVCSINNIDFQSFKEKSSSNTVLNKYKQNTQLAYEFGVFGVPSFSVNENLFWGDDRLNDIVHLKKELNLV
jgi:2-hydroxychromene-2-carboxylate isomerase